MELKINNISKKFKNKLALNSINMELKPGIWGLLGANGAGKTTLMRILTTVIKPTSGDITFNGKSIFKLDSVYRDIVGFLPQNFGFDPDFTVIDYLNYIASLKGLTQNESDKKIEELSKKLTLSKLYNKKISTLSGGMRQRVGIAQALLNDPRILIFDEPTSGLDPGERIKFRNLLSQFATNRIVIISTHIVPDIETTADKTIVLKDGNIININSNDLLTKEVEGKVWSCNYPASKVYEIEDMVQIINMKSIDSKTINIRYIAEDNVLNGSLKEVPTLEDYYLWKFPMDNGDTN